MNVHDLRGGKKLIVVSHKVPARGFTSSGVKVSLLCCVIVCKVIVK